MKPGPLNPVSEVRCPVPSRLARLMSPPPASAQVHQAAGNIESDTGWTIPVSDKRFPGGAVEVGAANLAGPLVRPVHVYAGGIQSEEGGARPGAASPAAVVGPQFPPRVSTDGTIGTRGRRPQSR
jgi:hypothetical protein